MPPCERAFTFTVMSRTASEECAKEPESQTKWMQFDVIELRDNSAAVDGISHGNEPPSYSEKDENGFVSQKNA